LYSLQMISHCLHHRQCAYITVGDIVREKREDIDIALWLFMHTIELHQRH
jgi:hypothetical protein